MNFVTDLFSSKNDEPSVQSLQRSKDDKSRIKNTVTAPMEYTTRTSRGAPPRRSRSPPRRLSLAANQRMRMNAGDKAIEFDKIAKSYLQCEKRLIEALRMSSTMSIDEKLDLIVKKRDECSQSQSDIVGGRRKTRRKKKRKSRRKSRKRKRKTKRRR